MFPPIEYIQLVLTIQKATPQWKSSQVKSREVQTTANDWEHFVDNTEVVRSGWCQVVSSCTVQCKGLVDTTGLQTYE